MTIDNVLEILEKHKLHIPSNVFYELKADIVNFEEPTTKNDLVVDCISRQAVIDAINANCIWENEYNLTSSRIKKAVENLPSVTLLSSELEKNSKKLEKNFGESDCISRADAIKAMQDKAKELKNEDTINGLCGAVAILFDLPSVTPQEPRWIPVSKRLPEEYKRVLVFDSWGGVYVGQYIDAEENWGGEHFINEAGTHSKTVVAWMPLPKPYREVEK